MDGLKTTGKYDEIDLFEYWEVLVRRKRLIGAITVGVFVLSVIVSLLLPKLYLSTASIMPPMQDDPFTSGVVSSLGGGLGGIGSAILGKQSPADLWGGILKSRTVNDAVIDRFGLRESYGKHTLEETRKKLFSMVSIDKTKEEIVSITVLDKDPQVAASIANAFVEELDRVNRGAVMTSGQRMRAFVEGRLKEARGELERLEQELREFQEKNKTLKLDDQAVAIIEAFGTVKGQLMAKEVELDTLRSYAAPTNPSVQILEAEVQSLGTKLRELERGKKGQKVGSNIFIPTDMIPGLAFRYMGLLRDAKVQQTLFELLTQQYEVARIMEAKDSPTVQVLDKAVPPERKARPRRGLIVVFFTALAFSFSIFMAFVLEYITRTHSGRQKC